LKGVLILLSRNVRNCEEMEGKRFEILEMREEGEERERERKMEIVEKWVFTFFLRDNFDEEEEKKRSI
jgi:hypothetical protein